MEQRVSGKFSMTIWNGTDAKLNGTVVAFSVRLERTDACVGLQRKRGFRAVVGLGLHLRPWSQAVFFQTLVAYYPYSESKIIFQRCLIYADLLSPTSSYSRWNLVPRIKSQFFKHIRREAASYCCLDFYVSDSSLISAKAITIGFDSRFFP